MVLMSADREMSPSSAEFIARVGSTTSAEDSAGMSGNLDMVWSDKMIYTSEELEVEHQTKVRHTSDNTTKVIRDRHRA